MQIVTENRARQSKKSSDSPKASAAAVVIVNCNNVMCKMQQRVCLMYMYVVVCVSYRQKPRKAKIMHRACNVRTAVRACIDNVCTCSAEYSISLYSYTYIAIQLIYDTATTHALLYIQKIIMHRVRCMYICKYIQNNLLCESIDIQISTRYIAFVHILMCLQVSFVAAGASSQQ